MLDKELANIVFRAGGEGNAETLYETIQERYGGVCYVLEITALSLGKDDQEINTRKRIEFESITEYLNKRGKYLPYLIPQELRAELCESFFKEIIRQIRNLGEEAVSLLFREGKQSNRWQYWSKVLFKANPAVHSEKLTIVHFMPTTSAWKYSVNYDHMQSFQMLLDSLYNAFGYQYFLPHTYGQEWVLFNLNTAQSLLPDNRELMVNERELSKQHNLAALSLTGRKS